jgi:hypothetical protein
MKLPEKIIRKISLSEDEFEKLDPKIQICIIRLASENIELEEIIGIAEQLDTVTIRSRNKDHFQLPRTQATLKPSTNPVNDISGLSGSLKPLSVAEGSLKQSLRGSQALAKGSLRSENITFMGVGMRYCGNHQFSEDDIIKLEKEDNNPTDKTAIKILVNDKKVAYVAKEYTQRLRKIPNFEEKEIKFLRNFPYSCKLELILNE